MRHHFGVLAFAASLVFASVSQAEFSAGGDGNETVAVTQTEPATSDGVANGSSPDVSRAEPSGTDETSSPIAIQAEPSAAEAAISLTPGDLSQPEPSAAAAQSEASIQDQRSLTESITGLTSPSVSPAESLGADQIEAAVANPVEASAVGDAISSMPLTVFEAEPVLGTGESETTAAVQDPSASDSVADSAPTSVSPVAPSGTDEHEASVVLPAEPSPEEGPITAIPASFSQAEPTGGTDESHALAMTPAEPSGTGHTPQSLPDRDPSELNGTPGELPATAD